MRKIFGFLAWIGESESRHCWEACVLHCKGLCDCLRFDDESAAAGKENASTARANDGKGPQRRYHDLHGRPTLIQVNLKPSRARDNPASVRRELY